jgi:outer membrane immunogenic protein
MGMEVKHSIKRAGITAVALIGLLSVTAVAQETRSEISVQGTGFFTKDTDGNGIRDHVTNTGGFLVGYRYNINRWLAAEANYGYDRNTETYFGNGLGRVQSNVHQVTGSAVIKLPTFARLQPYALAGGGALLFDPTGNAGGTFAGATWEAKGAFVYGAGADYAFTRHISLRAEYRGYVYKAPDFNLASLNTDSWTHTAQPSVGIVFRF